jgi:hypothetical protein
LNLVPDHVAFKSIVTGRPWGRPLRPLDDELRRFEKRRHIDGGIPKTFVFSREGKLVAEAINMRTQRQLLNMLAPAGIQP